MLLKLSKPTHCGSCLGKSWDSGRGYVPADGSGENGVLVVAEAAGEHETLEGMPLVGKAGHYLFQHLKRVGIEREGFRLHNVLSCRPPNNWLSKAPYEAEVIRNCAPLLDATIEEMQQTCAKNGRNLVILTLGKIAFKRIMDMDDRNPILHKDYLSYPFWSERYQAFVIGANHPSYLMRGQHKLVPELQFAFQRALEIAERGLIYATPHYLLDPAPPTFANWSMDYFRELERNPNTVLSYDIETAYKQGMAEDELTQDGDGDDYTILRCSFAYRPNEAVSIPWTASYRPIIEDLFASNGSKIGWNSDTYDLPRVSAQLKVNGDQLDAMLMWHVLNSSLEKRLGYVAPFYAKDIPVWKYQSSAEPAFYNAKDADVALRCYLGIRKDLDKANLWPVIDRHVIQLRRTLNYMSEKGVKLDQEMRADAEVKLQDLLDITELKMEASIPAEVRKFKIYKKAPKDTTGMVEVEKIVEVKTCPNCGEIKPKVTHFKALSQKKIKAGQSNPCEGLKSENKLIETKLWAKPLEFKISKVGLTGYQKFLKHQAIISREKKITFDEPALMKLIKKYPNDPLYPLIMQHRHIQKLLSTYVGVTNKLTGRIKGGMTTGKDGKIHTLYTFNPSTLRLASQNPNMQQLPRG